MQVLLSIIWLAFAAVFALLGRRHWRAAADKLPHLEIIGKPIDSPDSDIRATIQIGGMDVDEFM